MRNLIFLVISLLLVGVPVQLRISVAISIFSLALITALFKGLGVVSITHLITKTLTHLDTINMILVIIIVTYLGEILKTSGLLSDISSTFKKIFSPRIFLPLFALVIGLLPMPGGALVSAPMVEEGSEDVEIDPEEKALLNFWFRHVWEPVSPLYPEFLLAVSILGTTIGKLISIQWPVSLGMLLAGVLFITPLVRSESKPSNKLNLSIVINILRSLSPIIFIFIILVSFKNLPSFFAMLSGLVYLIIMKRVSFSKLKSSFRYKKIIEYAFLIYSIFFLREIITSTNFAVSVYTELQILKAPNYLILFLLPFSIGFLAGISSASIGIAYPLLMPLLKSNGVLNSSNVLIAYLGVWTALLFTPMHLCLSLSVDYFKTNFAKVYKLMLKPFLLLLILTYIWIIFLKFKP